MNFDDVLNRYRSRKGAAPAYEFNENTAAKPEDAFAQAGINPGKQVLAAGGWALTQVVKGFEAVSQPILQTLHQLQTDKDLYADLAEGKVADVGQRLWGTAAGAFDRSLKAKNLNDLGTNATTGVDLIDSMPGKVGEYFRDRAESLLWNPAGDEVARLLGGEFARRNEQAKATSKQWSKFVTGLALEMALTPGGAAAKAGAKLGGAVGKAATRVGIGGAANASKIENITARLGADAVTGNWVVGPTAIAIRESTAAAIGKIAALANDPTRGSGSQAAAKFLQTFVSPFATASERGKVALTRYLAMEEELPRQMTNVARSFDNLIARLPKKSRTEAHELMSDVVVNFAEGGPAYQNALDRLRAMGVDPNRVQAMAAEFTTSSSRLVDTIEAAGHEVHRLPGHLRHEYRIFSTPGVQLDHLDYLIRSNTPASWDVRYGDLGQRVRGIFGINTETPRQAVTERLRRNNQPNAEGAFRPIPTEQGDVVSGAYTAAEAATRKSNTRDALNIEPPIGPQLPATAGGRDLPNLGGPGGPMPSAGFNPGLNEALLTSKSIPETAAKEYQGAVPSVAVRKEHASEFVEQLQDFLDGTLRSKGTNVVDNQAVGETNEAFASRVASKQSATAADIVDFAQTWAREKGYGDELARKLSQSVTNAMLYVPGSREFAYGLMQRRSDANDFWTTMRKQLDLQGTNPDVFKQRTLDPKYYELLGYIDEFGPRAVGQATAQGTEAARAMLYRDFIDKGVVQDAPFLGSIKIDQDISGFENLKGKHILPGDLYAVQAISREVDSGWNKSAVGRALTRASNLFRRSALITDVSSHKAQWLGNIAFLAHAGLTKMFEPHEFVDGARRSFKSLIDMDETYRDAVDSGVQISMTLLNERQRAVLNDRVLLGSRGERADAFAQRLFSGWQEALTRPFAAVESAIAGGIIDRKARQAGRLHGPEADAAVRADPGTAASAAAVANLINPSAMFALPDMMTRMYAFTHTTMKSERELLGANPWLAQYRRNDGRVSWKQLSDHLERQNLPEGVDVEEVRAVLNAWSTSKTDAAKIANDVALNYADVPELVEFASKSGLMPFVKFQYKSFGRIMEWLAEKPAVFAPYYQAQHNAVAAFDMDEWDRKQEALPENIRGGLVLPLPEPDELGRTRVLDLSRWVPFGAFAQIAGGGNGNSGDGAPNNIASYPMLELAANTYSILYGDGKSLDGRPLLAAGQSKIGAVAEQLAATFMPAGIGPGGRRAQALAAALEQSIETIGEDGQFLANPENPLVKAAIAYGNAPANVGAALGNAVGMQGTGTGQVSQPAGGQTSTTPSQAISRGIFPGMSFSVDSRRTAVQIDEAFETRITSLKSERSRITNNLGRLPLTPQLQQRITQIDEQIGKLEIARDQRIRRLTVGE